jgi:hypothetical protein
MDVSLPVAEVLVEGELSPFEHEALYKLLKKHFRVEQPSYSELPNEIISTHVNIIFHDSYYRSFFTEIIREDWRNLKELFNQISYRRSQPGAAFTLCFVDQRVRLIFSLGILGGEALGSAMDQIAHLPGIIGQMISPERLFEPLDLIMATFDPKSESWHEFRGFDKTGKKEYVFDETAFRWKKLDTEYQKNKTLANYFANR